MNKINPISYFPNPADGRPISGGSLYIGISDTDPAISGNQKQVYALQENGTFTAIAQPVSLSVGGTPVYNGGNVSLFVSGDYSIKVLSSSGSQIFYIPDSSVDLSTEQGVYDTVAQLTASTPTLGAIYKTKGYYAVGDGGGATYLIVSGNSGDGYGSFNIGANTAKLIDTVVTSKMYGAKADGVTDDQPALQAFIDWAISTGMGEINLSPGNHLISSQLLVAPENVSDVISFNITGPGIEECFITSGFTGDVLAQNTAGFAILVDGIRNSEWSGFTVNYSVASDLSAAGRGGICGVCLSQSFYNNSFDRLGFIGGATATDRETDTRRSIKIIGNQAASSSTGYVSYFNKIYRSRFNIAYTHVECVEGDGDPGTSQPNATFISAGNLFERYIVAIDFNNTDECMVDGFDNFFQQAAGVGGINGGETYCVYTDGSFTTLKFSCEPGASSRPFALGANADRVIAQIVSNASLTELIDPANTGKLLINIITDELEGVATLNRRVVKDINIFGNGTSAHTGSTTSFVNIWRKLGSTNKLAIGFDDTSSFARVAVTGQNLDLRPVNDTDDVIVADSVWNQSLMRLGNYYFWVDGTGDFRIKNGAPTSDTDGTIVGTQS